MKNELSNQQVNAKLDELTVKRENWEQGSYRTSNKELYSLLEDCLVLLQQVEKKRALNNAVTARLSNLGITFRANTSLETRIVRCVFGDCGKRAYAYASALREAAKYKRENLSMETWIDEQGGIEQIRRTKNGTSPKQVRANRISVAKQYFADSKQDSDISIDGAVDVKTCDTVDLPLSAAILRKQADGTVSLVYTTDNEAVLNELLARAGADGTLAAESKLAQRESSETKAQNQAAIDAVVNANKKAA